MLNLLGCCKQAGVTNRTLPSDSLTMLSPDPSIPVAIASFLSSMLPSFASLIISSKRAI